MPSTAFTRNVRASLPPPRLDASTKVLVVGRGRFGRHVQELLHDKSPWLNVDVYEPGPTHIGDGSFGIGDYDIIILAVPIREYENVVRDVVPRSKESGIIIDVASVKMHTMKLLHAYAGKRYWIATHPMWGPQSYLKTNKDISGYRLVVTGHTLPKDVYNLLHTWIAGAGITIIKKEARHHDGDLAQTLFVAHFFGRVVARAGLRRTDIDTVSFGYLMNMVESVIDDEELFLDVVRYNRKLCSAVLRRIEKSTHEVRLLIEGVPA